MNGNSKGVVIETALFEDAGRALRRLAHARLSRAPCESVFDASRPTRRGDHDLNPHVPPNGRVPGRRVRPAAVLVPIVMHPGELTVLLTRRGDGLPSHAGQVAFPGGKVEEHDNGPLETALRESEEEIGLDRGHIDVVGYLDSYETGTGFRIVPVVGLVRPGFDLTLDPGEVTEAFEVPLRYLMDESNHQRHAIEWEGFLRHYYAMPFGDYYIWGATAGMLRNLHERLFGECFASS